MHSPHDPRQPDESIFGDAEPERDAALRRALVGVVGVPPEHEVDWEALTARISAARSRHGADWWSHVARWERRALPVALAASLAGALALWGLGTPPVRTIAARAPSDAVTALFEGVPMTDAAQSYARSLTAVDELAVETY